MEQERKEGAGTPPEEGTDIRGVVREAIEEYARKEIAKAEPAYRNELVEERKRREQLERRVNELVQENLKSRKLAEEAERNSTIRAEHCCLAKVDQSSLHRSKGFISMRKPIFSLLTPFTVASRSNDEQIHTVPSPLGLTLVSEKPEAGPNGLLPWRKVGCH